MRKIVRYIKRLLGRDEEEGQGLVEYALVIAFVGVLIAMAFAIKGSLFTGISNAYSSASSSLNALNAAATSAGGPQ